MEFSRFDICPDGTPTPPVRRALDEAAAYLEELTCGLNQAGPCLSIGIRAGAPAGHSPEEFDLGISRNNHGIAAAIRGATPVAAARGVSCLLGMVEMENGGPTLPVSASAEQTPRVALRGMHLNGWAANHPYAFRCWSEQDWRRYIDILFHEGANLLFLWPSMDIMPVPLSPEDKEYLQEVRRVVAYAKEERGMAVWIMHSVNRVAVSDCGVADPRRRPYWLPDAQIDLDPGAPADRERILRSREPLYRIVNNADGFAMIDSDPGGWNGSPVSALLELFCRTRELLDTLTTGGRATVLVNWLWQGWGFTTWDPDNRLGVIEKTVALMRERLPEPWMLIAGTGHYLPTLRRLGVLHRTVALPYGAIEAEPSLPFTNVDPASIDGALDGLAGYPELAGIMGNVQCPILQFPQVHHLLRGLWKEPAGDPEERADLPGLARSLYPGHISEVAAAFAALNGLDSAAIAREGAAVMDLLNLHPAPGLLGRLLFPTPLQILRDLASQLEVRTAEASFAASLEDGSGMEGIRIALASYFRACLIWEERHGYYGVLRIGRLNSLFPRPPIPRETIRTWPPFMPYAIRLRALLSDEGDPQGEHLFGAVQREMEGEFDPEKVRRGCITAMQVMLDRARDL